MLRGRPTVLQHGPLTVGVTCLDGCPGLLPFVRALPPAAPVVWLDSARHHPVTGRWSLLGCDPWLTLIARGNRLELRTSESTRVWRQHPLEALRAVLRQYRATDGAVGLGDAGRAVGLLGFLSYDLNRWIESLPNAQGSPASTPEMLWFGMRTMILEDHVEQRTWLLSVVDPRGPKTPARRAVLDALQRMEEQLPGPPVTIAGTAQANALEPTTTQAEFEAMVSRALELIRAGDIYQVTVAQRFSTSWREPTLPLYESLRRINPSPFACFLSAEGPRVVSCSPERLVRAQAGRVETRPIAGTRPRGATPSDDAFNSLELLLSEKERAEHIMLVDLARNDLGRVCRTGSVGVNELMTLEDYSHVIHIVSDVSGVLRDGVDAVDVIRAVFPGGTITGCPKVRCMQILRELEPTARGLYTGSLGVLGFDGTMDLNIAIRTMVVQDGRLSFHVGAGIVADSDPEREYHETMAKAGALIDALRAARAPAPEHRALSPSHVSIR